MFKSNRIYTHFLLTVSHRILHTEAQTARAARKCKQLLRFCLYEQWVNIGFTLKQLESHLFNIYEQLFIGLYTQRLEQLELLANANSS